MANIIFARVNDLFPGSGTLDPKKVNQIEDAELKNSGISSSKVRFIKNLSSEFIRTPSLVEKWKELDNESALTEIQKLKGLGPWSANIVLLFYMGRIDVFPFGDSTLKKAFLNIYGSPLGEDLKELEWAKPYRSIVALYFWRWVDQGMKKLL